MTEAVDDDGASEESTDLDAVSDLSVVREQAIAAAKDISVLSASAAAQREQIALQFQSLAAMLMDAEVKLASINAAATQALSAKTKIDDHQAVVAAKSAHIEDAQLHADKVRSELDRVVIAANQRAAEAEGSNSRAQLAASGIVTLLAQANATGSAAEEAKDAALSAQLNAEQAADTTNGLASRSNEIEKRLAAYEQSLTGLKQHSELQLETITSLLPSATSAGLAHAFDERRRTFINPGVRWQYIFVGSVVALVLLAATSLWQVYQTAVPLSYDQLLRLWLARLPIAGAVLWLALHASRESALAKRLEEDYGYKAAIASSFQGFQKQMADIGKAPPESPLAKLCSDTLATIASPPGRIYDRHKLTVSPTSEIAEAARTMVDVKGAIAKASADIVAPSSTAG